MVNGADCRFSFGFVVVVAFCRMSFLVSRLDSVIGFCVWLPRYVFIRLFSSAHDISLFFVFIVHLENVSRLKTSTSCY